MRKTLFYLLLVVTGSAKAQKECSCNILLNTAVSKIENIYVDRDNLKNNNYFRQIKNNLSKGKVPNSEDSCADVLNEIFSSFNDKHMRFVLYGDFSKYMRKIYDSAALQNIYNQFLDTPGNLNNIEGVWQNQGADQEFIILRNNFEKNNYHIVFWNLKSNPELRGRLKGSLKKISPAAYSYKSYTNGSAISFAKLEIRNNRLFSQGTGYWKKKIKGQNPDPPQSKLNPTLVCRADGIIVLTLPSFDISFKSEIDSILSVNNLLISNTKNLIIDIRENVGGIVPSYQSLLKWVYTNPIRIESAFSYASRENIEYLQKNRSDSGTSGWFVEQASIERMEKKLNTLILDSGYYLRYDSIYKFPQNIVVLTSYKSASASELFLISAKQSKKVTVIGENTYGSIDRSDMLVPEHACKNLVFTVPTVIRKPEFYKKPIDNIGIPPDIRAPQNVDWLQFAIDYLKKTR